MSSSTGHGVAEPRESLNEDFAPRLLVGRAALAVGLETPAVTRGRVEVSAASTCDGGILAGRWALAAVHVLVSAVMRGNGKTVRDAGGWKVPSIVIVPDGRWMRELTQMVRVLAVAGRAVLASRLLSRPSAGDSAGVHSSLCTRLGFRGDGTAGGAAEARDTEQGRLVGSDATGAGELAVAGTREAGT
jgi:hypothetical protein